MFKKTLLTLALGAALVGFSSAPAAADNFNFRYNNGGHGHHGYYNGYRPYPRYVYWQPRPPVYYPGYYYAPRPIYYQPVPWGYYRRPVVYPGPFFGLNLNIR